MKESSQEKKALLETILSCPHTRILEILSENSLTCQINILGETSLEENDPKKFVLKLHKKEFNLSLEDKNHIQTLQCLQKILSLPEKYFENDIYHKFMTKDLLQNFVDVELIFVDFEELLNLLNYFFVGLFSENYFDY